MTALSEGYICNECNTDMIEIEKGKWECPICKGVYIQKVSKPTKRYKCMVCGREFPTNNLPTINHANGCCTIGSMIEIKDE